MSTLDPSKLCGWRLDGGHKPIAARMALFKNVAPALIAKAPTHENVLLYKAFKEALGDYIDYGAQEIGDCTSFASAHANDLLQCVEISLGEASEFQQTSTEFIYGAARKLGNMLSNEDGCYGALVAKTMCEGGFLSRKMMGKDGEYSGKRAKDWGAHGPPAKYEDMALAFKMGGTARVTTIEEAKAAMYNGYPVIVCTRLGFSLERDKDGFCKQQGTWGHAMALVGARVGDRPGGCLLQSWGPDVPSGPLSLDQPPNSFWVDRDLFDYILKEGDSWAIRRSPEFGERELPSDWSYTIAA